MRVGGVIVLKCDTLGEDQDVGAKLLHLRGDLLFRRSDDTFDCDERGNAQGNN